MNVTKNKISYRKHLFFSNRQKFVAFDYYSFQNVGWLTDCINMRNNSFLILRSSNNWSFEIRRKIQSLTGSTFRIVFYIGGVEKNHFRSVVWCIWITVSFIQAVWIYMKCSLNWLEIMILIVTKLIKFNFAYKPFEDQKKIIISNFSYKNCDIVIKSNFFFFMRGLQVSEPILAKTFHRKVQSKKVFSHRESFDAIITKTEEKLAQVIHMIILFQHW